MKDQKKIRLGLIGVGNWALFAHVRVLRLLPEYEIVAIYSQRKEAAKAAATEYGIPHVAESLDALVTDPLVDQVLVLTTSQQHEEGIRAAITAGKDVYCEWPLTPTAAKSAELATLADAAGVKTQIGLQRQFAPAFRYVHDLVAQGYVGKVRSARMHVSVNMFGEIRANAVRWSLPIENFMSVVAIFGGHFFPVLFSVVGKPSSFSALTANQFPEVTIKETGEKIQTTSPDELLMHGTLADGGLFSIHIEGGKLSGSGVQIDITGDAGDLKITNTSAFGGVDEDFIVTGAQGDSKPLEHLPIPAKYEWFPRAGLQTGAAELGDLYVALSRDLASGTQAFRHSTMRSGSSSSSSRFKIRPKQVNASTCDFDRCCLQSGDNTGTHLHVSRKAICRPKQQLHVSTSMESPMSFVSRPWMFLIPSVTRFWCETPSSVSIL